MYTWVHCEIQRWITHVLTILIYFYLFYIFWKGRIFTSLPLKTNITPLTSVDLFEGLLILRQTCPVIYVTSEYKSRPPLFFFFLVNSTGRRRCNNLKINQYHSNNKQLDPGSVFFFFKEFFILRISSLFTASQQLFFLRHAKNVKYSQELQLYKLQWISNNSQQW